MTISRLEKISATLTPGGTRFAGSHLCDRFMAEAHEFLCRAGLLTGHMSGVTSASPRLPIWKDGGSTR